MNPEKLKQMQDQVRIGGKVRSYIHLLYLEMGKNPNPATTNQTRTQVSSRAETEIETESKNVQKPKQNRTVPYDPNPNPTFTEIEANTNLFLKYSELRTEPNLYCQRTWTDHEHKILGSLSFLIALEFSPSSDADSLVLYTVF